jgi:hypothetical protein
VLAAVAQEAEAKQTKKQRDQAPDATPTLALGFSVWSGAQRETRANPSHTPAANAPAPASVDSDEPADSPKKPRRAKEKARKAKTGKQKRMKTKEDPAADAPGQVQGQTHPVLSNHVPASGMYDHIVNVAQQLPAGKMMMCIWDDKKPDAAK